MALETLSDAEFAGLAMNHHRATKNDHGSQSIQMAQNFANRKKWLDANRARIETVLSAAALADFDAQVAAVDASIDKLFADGLQSQTRDQIKAMG